MELLEGETLDARLSGKPLDLAMLRDVVMMPRGLVLPPDVPKEAQQWWIETVKKIVQTPEWKAYIDKQLLTENVLYGDDFRAFLERTQGTFAEILKKSGAIK